MATGYTQAILDGATFEQFAMGCARAFGANIMMRDEHPSTPIKPYEVDPYHIEQVAEAQRRVDAAATMTLREAGIAAQTEYEEALERREECLADRRRSRAKYEAMLAEVKAWEPPTPDHAKLKKYMEEQILDSIKWDCSEDGYPLPKKKTGAQWLDEEMFEAQRSLEYHERLLKEEREHVAKSNAWNEALFNSLRRR